ncbi:aminoacyl-tRNA hydrolase [Escherichia coli]|nr:hypothetical protein [Escherichia coli]
MTVSKCYIIIREDLDMPVGKLAAQAGHAVDSIWSTVTVAGTSIRGCNAVGENPRDEDEKILNDFSTWVQDGRRKIILKAKSEEQMLNLFDKVKAEGFTATKIHDYGFNHFDGLTLTGFVVFPCTDEVKALKRVRLW